MPWKPSTDFEEEIVNLQPDHDFIFGALSEPEPQPFYPRPQSHIEYAATKKKQTRQQQQEYEETGRINNRLHAIAQVQRIAGTKPLGQQPTLDDWNNNKNTEKEIVAMMRHFGLGPSVEEPLNEKLTIATYPIRNGVEIVQNRCKKIPLIFDDNLFKLKPKESSSSNSSNSFDSACGNSNRNNNNSTSSNGDLNTTSSTNSCDTNSYSFHTPSRDDDSIDNAFGKYEKKQENDMFDYRKLHNEEDTREPDQHNISSCTQSSSCYSPNYSTCGQSDGYETATSSCSTSKLNPNAFEFVPYSRYNGNFSSSGSSINHSVNRNATSEDNSLTIQAPSFLPRFLKLSENDLPNKTKKNCTSAEPQPNQMPPTYANMARKPLAAEEEANSKANRVSKQPSDANFPPLSQQGTSGRITNNNLRFYTPRQVYERRRGTASALH
ncbi:putative uncharacterized protein DDB_G0282133 [Musca domestica]|uniref:Uncharacterized protein n=1 Tax=Musca domestica TaxID=7370 RepID=A0ABM3V738_MUSDO|nr:putative uncharacterized protein DDB_G0282133 [Musca domestica]XP_058981602.1 putative uncharacterized protein DDB_G0282133 [Musca domestica]